MKKRVTNSIIVSLILILLLSTSFASAFSFREWFNKITGRATGEAKETSSNVTTPDTAEKEIIGSVIDTLLIIIRGDKVSCKDSDAQFLITIPEQAGKPPREIYIKGKTEKIRDKDSKVLERKFDKCKSDGKKLTEYSCTSKGTITSNVYDCELGCNNGICIRDIKVCAAVCVPMYDLAKNCKYIECGSGCGPDNIQTFVTEKECEKQKKISLPTCGNGVCESADNCLIPEGCPSLLETEENCPIDCLKVYAAS